MSRTVGRARALAFVSSVVMATTMVAWPAAVGAREGDVIRRGSCSSGSDWKLKLSPEHGQIEVEFEVDQNQDGQTWYVKLKHDGTVFWRGHRTTQPPSGSFEVRRVTGNGAGPDVVVGRARNPKTDEVCRGVATFT